MNNEQTTAVLELQNIRKNFKQGGQKLEVLTGVELTVGSGEIVALTGPSGSGKSTLLQIAGLLETPTEGAVLLAGQNCAKLGDGLRTALRRDYLGFVYQYHNLLPDFSALENVMLPSLAAEESYGKARMAAMNALDKCGIADLAQSRPHDLSAGQKQIASVARAIVNDPLLVLADEPCAHLDADNAQHLMDLLGEVSLSNVSVIVA